MSFKSVWAAVKKFFKPSKKASKKSKSEQQQEEEVLSLATSNLQKIAVEPSVIAPPVRAVPPPILPTPVIAPQAVIINNDQQLLDAVNENTHECFGCEVVRFLIMTKYFQPLPVNKERLFRLAKLAAPNKPSRAHQAPKPKRRLYTLQSSVKQLIRACEAREVNCMIQTAQPCPAVSRVAVLKAASAYENLHKRRRSQARPTADLFKPQPKPTPIKKEGLQAMHDMLRPVYQQQAQKIPSQ